MHHTLEMGPPLLAPAPEFTLYNHDHRPLTRQQVTGPRGLLLGFTGDTWQPASVRRILWLQRHAQRFQRQGVHIALLLCDQPHTLYGFYMSSASPLLFPLLADVDYKVHRAYRMEHYAGLLLIDAAGSIRDKWLVPDERVWPHAQELMQSFSLL
jgi:peroxiredoxin